MSTQKGKKKQTKLPIRRRGRTLKSQKFKPSGDSRLSRLSLIGPSQRQCSKTTTKLKKNLCWCHTALANHNHFWVSHIIIAIVAAAHWRSAPICLFRPPVKRSYGHRAERRSTRHLPQRFRLLPTVNVSFRADQTLHSVEGGSWKLVPFVVVKRNFPHCREPLNTTIENRPVCKSVQQVLNRLEFFWESILSWSGRQLLVPPVKTTKNNLPQPVWQQLSTTAIVCW